MKIREYSLAERLAASNYVKESLAVMYGSVDEALKQIGAYEFAAIVTAVLKALPNNPRKKGAGGKSAICICKDEPYASREGWNKDCPVHGAGGSTKS